MVGDVLWAMTRVDRGWPDRLVYEEFALPQYDAKSPIVRRRQIGPADYTRLGVFVRHAMMAAAAVLVGDPGWYTRFFGPRASQVNEFQRLFSILTPCDANELRRRVTKWPR